MHDDHTTRTDESTPDVPSPVADWVSEASATPDGPADRPDACASCRADGGTQWLRLVTDWTDDVCQFRGLDRPDDACLAPLCNRCRAWAELIEVAEMAVPVLSDAEANRIRAERNRFLESLDVELVRGLQASHRLSAFSE
jgi:hypothetical protein